MGGKSSSLRRTLHPACRDSSQTSAVTSTKGYSMFGKLRITSTLRKIPDRSLKDDADKEEDGGEEAVEGESVGDCVMEGSAERRDVEDVGRCVAESSEGYLDTEDWETVESFTEEDVQDHDNTPVPQARMLSLPVELLSQIAADLDTSPMSLVAWSCTCRTLNAVLPRPELEEWDREELQDLLRRDGREVFLASCKAVDAGNVADDKVPCAGCVWAHAKSSFGEEQMVLPTTERYCRRSLARAGKLWICPHVSFSRREVWHIYNYLLSATDTNSRGSPYRSLNLGYELGPRPFEYVLPIRRDQQDRFHCEHWVYDLYAKLRDQALWTQCSFTIKWTADLDITERTLETRRQLQDYAFLMCPHLQNELLAQAGLMNTSPEERPYTSLAQLRCKARDCVTKVEVKASPSYKSPVGPSYNLPPRSRISIDRHFGRMQDLMDPAWLAQMGISPLPPAEISSWLSAIQRSKPWGKAIKSLCSRILRL